ncbi:hypothetical protein PV325_013435 [Microctonus aethiopoides]|nr:hypothetical protein PV325_013435 [Microctonus aethiopoides]
MLKSRMKHYQALCYGFVPARKPTIATHQLHNERGERERPSSCNNININNDQVICKTNHNQSRKEDCQQLSSTDTTSPANVYHHPRLAPPYQNQSGPLAIGGLSTPSVSSVSSASIPPSPGSGLPPLNIGPSGPPPPPPPPPPIPIGPNTIPPIPAISSLTTGIGQPPPAPPLNMPLASMMALHLPPPSPHTIHSSQHSNTLLNNVSTPPTIVSTSAYSIISHQHPQIPMPQIPNQHNLNSAFTTTTNSLLASGTMSTHATHSLTTPGVVQSPLNTTTNHLSQHIGHSSSRVREVSTPTTIAVITTMPLNTPSTSATILTTTASTNVATLVTVPAITSASTPHPTFVRPFEDSFRSTTKPHTWSIVNNHNSTVTNQINHQDIVKPSTAIHSTNVQTYQQDNNTNLSTMESSKVSGAIYSPHQQYHHHSPHLSGSNVTNLYKPQLSTPIQHSLPSIKQITPISVCTTNGDTTKITTAPVITTGHFNINGNKTSSGVSADNHDVQQVMTTQKNGATLDNGISVHDKSNASVNYYGNVDNNFSTSATMNKHANTNHRSILDVPPRENNKIYIPCNDVSSTIAQSRPTMLNQNARMTSNSSVDNNKYPIIVSQQVSDVNKEQISPVINNKSPSICAGMEKNNKVDTNIALQINKSLIDTQTSVVSSPTTTTTTTTTAAATTTTLYQPAALKRSINEISQKEPPIDTNILQSIKSEEVLRTCQNVSNVLLQIPKYQEKLLNFSNNELKGSYCYTDKCNNLTEIATVKCEPAVLNVPDPTKALNKIEIAYDDGKSMSPDDTKQQLTSTLDLAEKRRKRKRERSATCSSDSEGDDDVKDVDLWITKGPPAKSCYSEKKLSFLAIFGLTTLSMRNEIELNKLEKRYRLNPEPPEMFHDTTDTIIESILPIPKEHPDVLLNSSDFMPKVGFLKTIGLDIMPPSKRDEAEVTWQYVLRDRKKRKSTNTVTVYCDRIAKAYSKEPPTLPKPPQKMRLLDKIKIKSSPGRAPFLPPLIPNIFSNYYPALLSLNENGIKQQSKVNNLHENGDYDDNNDSNSDKITWSSVEDVMIAFQKYSKEKSIEREILSGQMSKLITRANVLRAEAINYERMRYELIIARSSLESERRVVTDKIERINALVRNLR